MKAINRAGFAGLIFMMLFYFTYFAWAQDEWAVNGDKIYNTNAGNVGIGTTNPRSKLEIKTTDTPEDALNILANNGPSKLTIRNGGNNDIWMSLYDQSGKRTFELDSVGYMWYTGGNVGIGTTSPNSALDVRQTNINEAIATFTSTYGGEHSAGIGVDGRGSNWGAALFQDGITRFTVESNGGAIIGGGFMNSNAPENGAIIQGNVGIGTTDPDQALDIEGNLELNGSLVGGIPTARVYYDLLAARWGGAQTGALVIQTNVPQDDHTMTQTRVILKSKYSSGKTNCEYLISGYWSTEANGGFQGRGYQAQCSDIQRIRFMRNSGNGKVAIVVGETSTSWSHPMVAVPEFLAHYGISSDNYADYWTASIVNDLSGYANSDEVHSNSPIRETSTRVGIGTTNPGQTLDVEGNLELNGTLVGGTSSARVYYNLLGARWGGAQTGALVIKTNVPQDDHTMTQTKVILKRKYSSGYTNCEYLISGYWSTEANGGFQGRGYQAECNDIQRIRFMRSSESGKVAIVIGETTTSWSHPMVAVPEFLAHYGIASDNYADSWTASIVNDLSGYVNSDVVHSNSPIYETAARVGIGTTNPSANLDVQSSGSDDSHILIGAAGTGRAELVLDASNGDAAGSDYLELYQTDDLDAHLRVAGGNGNLILQESGGNVGIGTTSPPSELAVNGTITAKEIKVESGWSDFVFDEDYDLASLDEVESFIRESKHLPDIPSAKEVEKNGIAVSEMLAKQMQKIEEMTLYLIELKKENDSLKATVVDQERQLASLKELKARIEALEQRK